MKVFSGSSNPQLAEKVAKKLGVRMGEVELSRFSNDEARVWIKEKQVPKKVVLLQSLSQPTDHNLVEYVLMVDALKRMGVREIIAVIPWFGYSKQDKVFRKGEPLSAQVMAEIVQTGEVKKIITFDLHSKEIERFFKVPLINLSAKSILIDEFRKIKNAVVAAPDLGAKKPSANVARELGFELVVIEKKRDLNTGMVEVMKMKGEVKNKQVLIFDDMIATGSTVLETTKLLFKKGAKSVQVAVVHHLYVNGAQKAIDKSKIKRLVVTDTINPFEKSKKLKVLSVAGLIAEEIGG